MLSLRTSWTCLLFASWLYLTVAVNNSSKTDSSGSTVSSPVPCDAARLKYRDAGYEDNDIYAVQQDDARLQVCSKSHTCCKPKAELNLVNHSEKLRKKIIAPIEKELKDALSSSASKFLNHFRSLITTSQQNLDKMYARTYGHRYEENAQVFKALYVALHQYLNGSELNLKSTVDDFFANLFQAVYVMSNAFDTFDANYKTCIHDSTVSVKPFGDMARKIEVQILRSFVASRVFLQGIKTAIDVESKLLNMPYHDDCPKSFMRMTQCGVCSGIKETKPCYGYCSNVVKGCFVYIMMVQPKWNLFLNEMVQLADKLQGPFSMEAIIGPLAVEISEAIMDFRDNQENITQRVVKKCGKPSTSNDAKPLNAKRARSRFIRAVDPKKTLDSLKHAGNDERLNLPFLINFNNGNSGNGQPSMIETEAERLAREAKTALTSGLDYWVKLPQKLCDGNLAADQGSKQCWNGHNSSGYSLPVVGDSITELFHKNPEVDLDLNLPNWEVLTLANELQSMRYRIQAALEGNDYRNEVDETGSGSTAEVTTGMPDDEDDCASGESGDGSEGSGEGSACGGKTKTAHPPTDFPNTVEVIKTYPHFKTNGNEIPSPFDGNYHLNSVEAVQGDPRGAASLARSNFLALLFALMLAILWQYR